MQAVTLYWLAFVVLFFALMFAVIPSKRVPEVSHYGFWMGLVQAIVILGVGQGLLNWFKVVGGPVLFGVPVLAAVSWIPPAILFEYFFPLHGTTLVKFTYVLLFAVGTSFAQFIMQVLGMWENIRWSVFHTFGLALITHTIMTVYRLAHARREAAT